MFDAAFPPSASGPTPPRPAPLNVYPWLPLLRARAAEDAVEMLASAAVVNALCAKDWVVENWSADADLRDHNHPAHTAALDPSSPLFKLAETQCLLAEACTRYQVATGRDGLALARETIERRHSPAVASAALGSLTDRAPAWWEIDALLFDDPEPPPEPTPAERRAAAKADADWLLSYPDMGDLGARLEVLLAACKAEGDVAHGQRTAAALEAVGASIEAMLRRAGEGERMLTAEMAQLALNAWTAATGGPRINLQIGDQTSPSPGEGDPSLLR